MNGKTINKFKSFDIENFLSKNDIEFKDSDTQYILRICPFCGKDKWKLYISKEKKIFFCFKCEAGIGQNIAHLVAEIKNITYEDAKNEIKGKLPYLSSKFELKNELEDDIIKDIKVEIPDVLQIIKLPYNFYSFDNITDSNKNGYRYCLKRGVSLELAKMYDIRFNPTMNRIIFPVKMFDEYVGWQGRDITDRWKKETNYPKSLTSKGFKKSLMLYNYDRVKDCDTITITEGPIDAIKCFMINGVALFGKTLSDRQFELIRKMPNLKHVVIALDPEEIKAIDQLAKKLNIYYDISIINFPSNTDAGDYSPETIYDFYSRSKDFNYLEL